MTEQQKTAPGWDGRGVPAHVSGYHWVRRSDVPGHNTEPVIWTWRADAQVWRWGWREMLPNEMAAHFDWIAAVASQKEVERLQAEVSAMRYAPMGDNHHNALACPYCNPEGRRFAD